MKIFIPEIRFCNISKKDLQEIKKLNIIPKDLYANIWKFKKSRKKRKELIHQYDSKKYQIFHSRSGPFHKSNIIKNKNSNFINYIKRWINDDNFFKHMKIGLSMAKFGWAKSEFHSICDNKGKTFVLIKSAEGYIFGGFTEKGWISDSEKWDFCSPFGSYGLICDPKAFLFSLNNYWGHPPQKFPIKNASKFAVKYDYHKSGPDFHDICAYGNEKEGNSDLFGDSYQIPQGINQREAYNYFTGSQNWVIEGLEIYFV
ncbi:pep-cterm sorting domain-containing protein [Anaeramoeba ignava]|uniref:Pep-cterm sorting domain-containing protein n=1 Tax=Anaeramoeba ignava TaxID=1746090 RepID=A0A9Q0RBN0_ANAIG|nr:pep-cterm sorting domain-containing protein [Anaeramoeba ignava]